MKLKKEPIDIEMQTSSKSHHIESTSEEVEVKSEEEEKFSAREEFSNKISIAILNEEVTSIQATTISDIVTNNTKNKKSK